MNLTFKHPILYFIIYDSHFHEFFNLINLSSNLFHHEDTLLYYLFLLFYLQAFLRSLFIIINLYFNFVKFCFFLINTNHFLFFLNFRLIMLFLLIMFLIQFSNKINFYTLVLYLIDFHFNVTFKSFIAQFHFL